MSRITRALLTMFVVLIGTVVPLSYRSAQPVEAASTSTWTSGGDDAVSLFRFASYGDGVSSAEAVEGKTANRVSTNGYLYFFPPDPKLGQPNFPAGETYAKVEIEYYDEDLSNLTADQKIAQKFKLQYSTASSYADSNFVTLAGTGDYQTATFYLSGVKFTSPAHGPSNSIFRIVYQSDSPYYNTAKRLAISKVTITTDAASLTPDYSTATSVTWGLSNETGLALSRASADGQTSAAVMVDHTVARQVSSSGLAYFDVDDSYLFNGLSGNSAFDSAEVTVHYFDQGYGRWYINYDSTQDNTTIANPASFQPTINTGLQSNNVVYNTDSRTWKSYTFLLSNLKFANGANGADFRINYALDNLSATAGYLLAFDAVTVTRKSAAAHVDRKSIVQGITGDFGDPFVVWTRLASKNEGGHGLYQLESAGGTSVDGKGGDQGRRGTAVAFDVNDNYILNGTARNVLVTIEYKDSGSAFRLRYDSATGQKDGQTVTPGSTGAWKTYTFSLTDARFGNSINGADFALVGGGDVTFRNVYVFRSPGRYVQPRASSLAYPQGFSKSQPVVSTIYFPIFDGYYPTLWEGSTFGPPGASAVTQSAGNIGYTSWVSSTYSFRSTTSVANDLRDMEQAGVDIVFPDYASGTTDATFFGGISIQTMVKAHRAISSNVKIGLFVDTVNFFHEPVMKPANTALVASAPNASGMFFRLVEDFYSLVPPDMVATMDGKPIILLYGPTGYISNDQSLDLAAFKARFESSFGVQPYVIADVSWDAAKAQSSELRPGIDEWFAWSAALLPEGYSPAWNNTFTVGPGFDETEVARKSGDVTKARIRDRANGAVYDGAWHQALNRRPHMVLIETWNYWAEGSAVAPSSKHGSTYYDKTRSFIADYKGTSYSSSREVSADLGAAKYAGVAPETKLNAVEEASNSQATPGSQGGRSAVRLQTDNLFFVIDDSFLFDLPAGTTGIEVDVTYWDGDAASGGADQFVLKWDGQSSRNAPAIDTLDNTVDVKGGVGQNTKTWRTRTFSIPDAKFANRTNARQDFYLGNAKGLWISKVVVRRPASVVQGVTAMPMGLTFWAPITGGAVQTPVPLTVDVTGRAGGKAAWTASTSTPWLSLSKTAGTTPDTLIVSAAVAGRNPSTAVDSGKVTITGADGSTVDVTALLAIGSFSNTVGLPAAMLNFQAAPGW